jgi:bifunctional enzyme CysN/CysC
MPDSLLRVLTCGSVDDGKSTLIGRLLYDTHLVLEDQLASLARDSRRHGTTGDDLDFALLVDGLEAEQQQGITIDVAYRFFATPKRRFIVADGPGHEQYTRNMATGASTADLAIVLVDARHGVLTQTRRHAFIASLLGIRHLVLAVNKIDLVGFDQARFTEINQDFLASSADLGFHSIHAIPLSARYGDNVTEISPRLPWYQGPCLLSYLETIEVAEADRQRPFRMPVQLVCRPNLDFRGYAGTIASGHVAPGMAIAVSGAGVEAHIARIVTLDGDLQEAVAGDAVTLVLDRELDVSRGDVLAAAQAPVRVADQFAAHVIWLAEAPLVPARAYLLKLGGRIVGANITRITHRVDVNTREKLPASTLSLNEVGHVDIALNAPLAFEPYADSRSLGGFILIDRQTNATVGVGMIESALRYGSNLTWQKLDVDKQARASLKHQKPAVIWFTGLSGAGKSTIANLVEKRLHALGHHTYVLDGDNVRHGLNRDLGFSESDRAENIRRISEVAACFVDAGMIVLVSFISPYQAERRMARERVGEGEFIEVFVDTPVSECRLRDPKKLYAKADAGLIRNFTGVDAPYEAPEHADIHLRTTEASPETMAALVVDALRQRGLIG